MAKLAIDVVLLPPPEIMDLAVRLNKKYMRQGGKRIALNTKTCLPHISLAMGVVESQDLSEISKLLSQTAKNFLPLSLTIKEVRQEGSIILALNHSRSLQSLHEAIMKKMAPFFSQTVKKDFFYHAGNTNQDSVGWVKSYKAKSSFERFSPHITLGYGEKVPSLNSTPFTIETLAVCYLGNHCTCRKVLYASKN